MVKVETLRSAHELDRLQSRWTWLQQQCETTLFQSYKLNRLAARWFAARETPHVVVAESDSGMAILPAVRRERELALIGEKLFDYRDVLSAGHPAVLQHAWRDLARLGLPIEVTALRGDATRERWQPANPAPFCNAPTTRISDLTAPQFATAHHKSAKASRKLARQGLCLIRRDSHPHDLALGGDAWPALRRVAQWVYHRKSEWRGPSANLFLDRHRQHFMLYVLRSALLRSTIWGYEDARGQIAAALVTFQHKQTRHFYTIHYDPQWEWYSPGQCLIYEVTRESLQEGLDVDYMTGEYPYKNRLASAMVPLYRVAASAAQLAGWKVATADIAAPAA